jgi:hypothetical protein
MKPALASDDQFFQALRAEDPLGAVVRAHIHIEARLNQVLDALVMYPEHLPNLRFEQRARLAVSLGLDERILAPLNKLGHIRNAFAHRLDVTLTDAMVNELFGAFSEEDQEIIVQAYNVTHTNLNMQGMPPYEKTDARHKFITMAVALDKFLIVAEREAREQQAA